MDIPKIDIPQSHQDFCKAVCKLAREHKLQNFSGSLRPGYDDPTGWDAQIEFAWEQGRHGDDSDKLFISSTKRVWTRLGPKE